MWKSLKSFDAYSKIKEEAQTKTCSGALITLISGIVIAVLFFSELVFFIQGSASDQVFIDVSPDEKIEIKFDITFPHIPCSMLSIDATDVTGTRAEDHHILKTDIDPTNPNTGALGLTRNRFGNKVQLSEKISEDDEVVGSEKGKNPMLDPNYCGSCFGAEDTANACCNTCDSVIDAYNTKGWVPPERHTIEQCVWSGAVGTNLKEQLEKGMGCNHKGKLTMGKGSGSFHFGPGKATHYAHRHSNIAAAIKQGTVNMTHVINDLSFGASYPGMTKPLNGVSKTQPTDTPGLVYLYYAKVVPTSYTDKKGVSKMTNQFSVNEHERITDGAAGHVIPGLYFFYSTSPIRIDIQKTRPAFLHFITQLCAILGGVYAVAGIVDQVVFSSGQVIQKKLNLGKQS